MTLTDTSTVAAIRAWIDEHPDDTLARAVLADALDEAHERGADPRSAGYRAMAELGRYSLCSGRWTRYLPDDDYWSSYTEHHHLLPRVWHEESNGWNRLDCGPVRPDTCAAGEDAAALAWGKLTAEEQERCREEILAARGK